MLKLFFLVLFILPKVEICSFFPSPHFLSVMSNNKMMNNFSPISQYQHQLRRNIKIFRENGNLFFLMFHVNIARSFDIKKQPIILAIVSKENNVKRMAQSLVKITFFGQCFFPYLFPLSFWTNIFRGVREHLSMIVRVEETM